MNLVGSMFLGFKRFDICSVVGILGDFFLRNPNRVLVVTLLPESYFGVWYYSSIKNYVCMLLWVILTARSITLYHHRLSTKVHEF